MTQVVQVFATRGSRALPVCVSLQLWVLWVDVTIVHVGTVHPCNRANFGFVLVKYPALCGFIK